MSPRPPLPAPAAVLVLFLSALPAAPAQDAAGAAAANRPAPNAVTADELRPHMAFLTDPARGGRPGGSADAAAEYLADRFAELELAPVFADDAGAPGFFQSIAGRDGATAGRNVAALLPGSDPALKREVMLVGAHYDHLGVRGGNLYPGADDNASGTAMLLEVAAQFAADAAAGRGPRRSLLFVGFDLEERMLFGSRWFAAHPPACLRGADERDNEARGGMPRLGAVFIADMIGRSLGDLSLPTVFVLGSEHAPELKSALDEAGVPDGLEAARLGIDLIGTRSDYGPFRDREIPFLFFSTGEHRDYHKPTDTLDRLDVAKAARVSTLIYDTVKAAANADAAPTWDPAPPPDLDEARAVRRITGLLLDRAADPENPHGKRFGTLQRLTLAQAKSTTDGILERGEMTPSERAWLVRLSQAMLLSVF